MRHILISLFFTPPAYLLFTDIEVAQYKAENVLLRREKDTLTQELRKAKGTAEFSGDRLTSTESETRRIKSQAQVRSAVWWIYFLHFP